MHEKEIKMPRPPKPINAIDNKVSKRTKAELEAREINEPKIINPKRLSCPKSLTEEARSHWRKLMRLHKKLDKPIWTEFDVAALARYCEHLNIWDKLQAEWRNSDSIFTQNKEDIGINPLISQMNSLNKILLQEEDKLCISIIGRARVGTVKTQIVKDKEEDDLLD